MKRNAIIFGSSGQDGYYLNKLLLENNIETILISRSSGNIIGDISDKNFVFNIIKVYKPNFIFHLAANSSTSHYALNDNFNSISIGTLNILESVLKFSKKTKVFIAGSALQFENNGLPISEKNNFDSKSFYSVSRIHATYLARYYRETLNIQVYIGYLFNHDSPLRSDIHINKKIIIDALKISRGEFNYFKIGDINVIKEFNYAGDIVDAIWKLVNQDSYYEVVIGCGLGHSIKEWIYYCFTQFNLDWIKYYKQDLTYKSSFKILVSDPKILMSFGWEPKINFHQLANMMILKIKNEQ